MKTRDKRRRLARISDRFYALETLAEHTTDPALLKTALDSLADAVSRLQVELREEIE